MTALKFNVVGTPAPQGSKRHVGNGVMVESSKLVKPWRQDVVAAAIQALPLGWRPLDEAVELWLTFYLRRPSSIPKRRIFPDRKPDLDKLTRATLDALSMAGVLHDDARVVDLHVSKRYAEQETGATIQVNTAVN